MFHNGFAASVMTNEREKSRHEWEQEIVARQQNVTPADYSEGLHYVRAKHLPHITSQVRFWIGIVLIAVGVRMFPTNSDAQAGFGACSFLAGLCLAITAMRFKD
jgi:hypothetical protein